MKYGTFTAPLVTPLRILNVAASTNIMYIKNNDPTNFFVFGFDDAVTLLTGMVVAPGETFPIALDANQTPGLYILADTAPVNIRYIQG